jgi:hypothetical protein
MGSQFLEVELVVEAGIGVGLEGGRWGGAVQEGRFHREEAKNIRISNPPPETDFLQQEDNTLQYPTVCTASQLLTAIGLSMSLWWVKMAKSKG